MSVEVIKSSYTVLEAAYKRIQNIFDNGVPIYLSTSGGKDSIVVCQLVYDLIMEGKVDPAQLTVIFVDEEGMYDDVIDVVMMWRKRFLRVGAKFDWYCIQVKHFNCLNYLTADEQWVCWDERERDKWMREPPPFAIMSHPLLKERVESYQVFMSKILRDGITITGVRVDESYMRRKVIANVMASEGKGLSRDGRMSYPIYDWADKDVWLFLKEKGCEIPNTYLYMYQVGIPIRQLRMSCFFATDTIGSLRKVAEYYPGLWEKIQRREPNAYMVSMYWDSEMFGRSTAARRQNESGESVNIDYQARFLDIVNEPEKHFRSKQLLAAARRYRTLAFQNMDVIGPKEWKKMYQGLIRGDTKLRSYRALTVDFYTKRVKRARSDHEERRKDDGYPETR